MRSVIVGLGVLLTASAAQAQVIWDTGAPHSVIFNGAPSNLGFSSGNVSATQPQRWAAMPFSIGAGGATIHHVGVSYFVPAGFEPIDIRYNIFQRGGLDAPNPPDYGIVNGGVLGLHGPGMNDPRNPAFSAGSLHEFTLGAPIALAAGDYYFSMYGGAPVVPGGFTNAAWFTGADLVPAAVQRDGFWRSATYPAPGFVEGANPAVVAPPEMTDPLDRWNCAYTLYGPQIPAPGAATLLGLGLLAGLRRRR